MLGMRRSIGIGEALSELRPTAQWAVHNNSFDEIVWYSEDIDQPTREEIELKIQELKDGEGMQAVREIRDWYLQQSDWTQGQDIRIVRGEEWCAAWDSYRQQLRDITSSGIDPYFNELDQLVGVVWPEKPQA